MPPVGSFTQTGYVQQCQVILPRTSGDNPEDYYFCAVVSDDPGGSTNTLSWVLTRNLASSVVDVSSTGDRNPVSFGSINQAAVACLKDGMIHGLKVALTGRSFPDSGVTRLPPVPGTYVAYTVTVHRP